MTDFPTTVRVTVITPPGETLTVRLPVITPPGAGETQRVRLVPIEPEGGADVSTR